MLHFPKANWANLITLHLSQCYLIQGIMLLGALDASTSQELL
jgi:hypothetical protein